MDGREKRQNSRKIYIPLYIMVVVLIAIITTIRIMSKPLNSAVLAGSVLFILILFIGTELHRRATSYQITSSYLVQTNGIFSKKVKKVAFPSISDINLKQNFWQRLLKYGTIHVYQYSKGSVTEIKNINKPEEFLDALGEKVGKTEGGLGKR